MDIQTIKQRFGIIGNAPMLNRAIDIAIQVATTDLTVLITGESGVGKENFPKIIHQLGARKHGQYVAVNCGAIPEGTIDSELFGHEKGAFTSADKERKGYFEVADGGTIFLDEVSELPLSTQVRLLRVLETGEFYKVGSSKVQKCNVRVVAATNLAIPEAIKQGRFREDLFYRLNTVPIMVPPLRERNEDILLLFRKFASDFAVKYRMPVVELTDDAKTALLAYGWRGNVRQLKNIAEQISIIEQERIIDGDTVINYLPQQQGSRLPVLYNEQAATPDYSERELFYKVLIDMKNDINDLKKLVNEIIQFEGVNAHVKENNAHIIKKLNQPLPVQSSLISYLQEEQEEPKINYTPTHIPPTVITSLDHMEVMEESLSLEKKEMDMIKMALDKYKGKRKYAAKELGISERTLYRKIKEYAIE